MSYPFIIWTMQRTGGTALTNLLMDMSEHPKAEHEPFNGGKAKHREFWPIVDAWNNTGNLGQLQNSLGEIFSKGILIKHCYELLNMPFNLHLMSIAASTQYRHIHLLRRDESSRLVSKFIAEAQGTWFKDYSSRIFAEVAEGQRKLRPIPVNKMVSHYKHCQNSVKTISDALSSHSIDVKTVYYEDIYSSDHKACQDHLTDLLTFIGFSQEDCARHRDKINETLMNSGQNTRSVTQYIPNLREVCKALSGAGCSVNPELIKHTTPQQQPQRAKAPKERVAELFQEMAESRNAKGPFLEICMASQGPAILAGEYFAGAERHVLTPNKKLNVKGATMHYGRVNDLLKLFQEDFFLTVISNGALAHDKHFWKTTQAMKRLLAPGGMLLLSVPGISKVENQFGAQVVGAKGNPIAEATITQSLRDAPDFWRFSPLAVRQSLLEGLEEIDVREAMMPPRIFGFGVKQA